MQSQSLTKVLGVVLIGGKSKRMGEDKASILINGEPFLDRAVNKLQSLNLADIVVSGAKSQVERGHSALNWIEDNYADLGPLSGIQSVLEFVLKKQMDNKICGLLIIPIDMPELSHHVLLTLGLTGLEQGKATYYKLDEQKYYFPLYLPVNERTAQTIDSALTLASEQWAYDGRKQRILSLRAVLDKMNVEELEADSGIPFININTPEDLKRFNSEHY